uniref:hypothetical protein n=1 Tax=Paractinoplanes polyasparticus TaxID=2856853 RepID=UPI001C86493F|nr:hypothetical protein [Actinoplanes polyasparticus]
MLAMITRRAGSARRALSRATVLPFLVRCAIGLCGVVAMSVAWPFELFATQYSVPLVAVALYPAFAPRGRGATFAALTVITGWVLDTTFRDSPVVLWRVLAIAAALYLGHSLTALAAVLPYDSVVNIDVPGLWVARALAVILISAVLTVLVLALSAELVGSPFLIATVAGLAGAAAATLLIARLIHRP